MRPLKLIRIVKWSKFVNVFHFSFEFSFFLLCDALLHLLNLDFSSSYRLFNSSHASIVELTECTVDSVSGRLTPFFNMSTKLSSGRKKEFGLENMSDTWLKKYKPKVAEYDFWLNTEQILPVTECFFCFICIDTSHPVYLNKT